jgi:hypothetical protein
MTRDLSPMKISRHLRIKQLVILCRLLKRARNLITDDNDLVGYCTALELRLSRYLQTLINQRPQ